MHAYSIQDVNTSRRGEYRVTQQVCVRVCILMSVNESEHCQRMQSTFYKELQQAYKITNVFFFIVERLLNTRVLSF